MQTTLPAARQPDAKLLHWLLMFVAIAALLAAAARSQILAPNLEIGDFAANSLLVQDAKSLSLWVGNYSRVGFNHPGPAILYVLAAGEAVFHDWLGIVPSPFSGQLVGVALYNAGWITLLGVLFARMLGEYRLALVATASFVLFSAACEPRFLSGAWFPYLYYFPFAVALLAMARLARGETDSLAIAAVAAGFLVNGHASFVALLGFILAVLLVYNRSAYRTQAGRVILRREFVRAHARDLLGGAATLAVFLVPLLVMTIRDLPGPLASYVQFGAGHSATMLLDAIRFVAVYWGGPALFVAGLIVCVALLTPAVSSAMPRLPLLDLPATILAATAAVLAYAKFGVDLLDQKYIGLFYQAAPVLLATVLATALFAAIGHWPKWVGNAAAVAMMVAVYCIGAQVPAEPQYRNESVRGLVDALRAHQGRGRIVLDLDDTEAWGQVWTMLAGAENLAKREGQPLFCVGVRWHVLFTLAGRCTPSELRENVEFVVTGAGALPREGEVFQAAGLSFRQVAVPDVAGGKPLLVWPDADAFRKRVLGSGWSILEAGYVWSDGPEASLSVPLPKGSTGELRLDMTGFVPRDNDRQLVEVLAHDRVLASMELSQIRRRESLRVPIADGAIAEHLRVRIRQPLPGSYGGVWQDRRRLGVALLGVQFVPR